MVSLEEAWAIWSECLKGNDENSVFRQITWMLWDAIMFRFVLESRQIQIEKNPTNPRLNGTLHNFLDRNFSNLRHLAYDVLLIRANTV